VASVTDHTASPVSIGARVFAGVPYFAAQEMIVKLDSGLEIEIPNGEEFTVWEDGRTQWPEANVAKYLDSD